VSELYGWTGKILRADLTNRTLTTVDTEEYVPKYIGGIGIAHRIAWDEIPKGVGAFDPENKLILMTGPLTGTPAPTSGRAEMCGVTAQGSPEQYAHSGIGGWFPSELKYAGFDGIIIQGKASSPCYLWVHDGEAEIKDASDLWGLGTYDTQERLRQKHGDYVRSICIGPAGENKSRIAVILTDTENAFGQGGFGGIAGGKNLKAICASGSKRVKIAHPEELLKVRSDISGELTKNPYIHGDRRASLIEFLNFPTNSAWHKRSCSQSCFRACFSELVNVPRKTRPGLHSGQLGCVGPLTIEWEDEKGHIGRSVWPLWSQTVEGGFEATELLQQYGLNEWEVLAGMVPWLVMGNRMGIITEELFGGPINPSKAEWWVSFLHMLAYREGFGDLLAEGVTRAINTLGKKKFGETIYTGTRLCGLGEDRSLQVDTPISLQEAWGYSEHHSGRGIHSFRAYPVWLLRALVWLTESKDPHNNQHIKDNADWLAELEKDPYLGEIGPAISFWNQIRGQLKSSLTLCDFAFPIPGAPHPLQSGGNSDAEARLFSAVTGISTTQEELDKAGLRLQSLYRAIQIRNYDRTRELEWNEVVPFFRRPDGTTGAVIDEDKFAVMVDNFYELHGWDKTTGWPTRAKLEELDLKDVADELEAAGKLP